MVDGSPWEWMGSPDAARYLGLGLRTLYRLIDVGELPAFQLGRVIRLRRHELDDYLERTRIKPGEISARRQDIDKDKWQWESTLQRQMHDRLKAFVTDYMQGGPVTCPLCGGGLGL